MGACELSCVFICLCCWGLVAALPILRSRNNGKQTEREREQDSNGRHDRCCCPLDGDGDAIKTAQGRRPQLSKLYFGRAFPGSPEICLALPCSFPLLCPLFGLLLFCFILTLINISINTEHANYSLGDIELSRANAPGAERNSFLRVSCSCRGGHGFWIVY